MRRLAVTTIVAAGLVMMWSGAAAGAPVQTFTATTKDGVSSFHQLDPCVGPVSVTLTYNSVTHATEIVSGPNAGSTHLAFTQTGSFVFEPDDPALPTYAGTFVIKGGFNATSDTSSSTVISSSVGRAPDDSQVRLKVVSHVLVTPDGVETSFSLETADCPELSA